jgi:hypothetical protein
MGNKDQAKSDAFIFQKGEDFIVSPGRALVDGSKGRPVFKIRNMTEYYTATVKLPATRVEEGDRSQEIEPNKSATFNLRKLDGFFEYQVFVNGKRAEANSDPVIIIDPPCS